MAKYQETRVKLTTAQLKNLKYASKNKTGKILRTAKKNFKVGELPNELFVTTWQKKTKIKNAFADNMSTDIKLSKAKISKIINLLDLLVLS